MGLIFSWRRPPSEALRWLFNKHVLLCGGLCIDWKDHIMLNHGSTFLMITTDSGKPQTSFFSKWHTRKSLDNDFKIFPLDDAGQVITEDKKLT